MRSCATGGASTAAGSRCSTCSSTPGASVHLAHAGFPLLGDALYGAPDPRGLMLHAHELAFRAPVTGEPVRIVAPVPARMLALFPHM